MSPEPGASASENLESLADRLSIFLTLLEQGIEADERRLSERKRDARWLAELAAEVAVQDRTKTPDEAAVKRHPGGRSRTKTPAEIRRKIVAMKRKHPDWGFRTIARATPEFMRDGKRCRVSWWTVKKELEEAGLARQPYENSDVPVRKP